MIKTSIEKMAYDIGKDIGHSDNKVQADLLNGLGHGLSSIQNKRDIEMQLCYIWDELSSEGKDVIVKLAEFKDY